MLIHCMSNLVISIDNISKSFSDRQVLSNISLQVWQNDFISIQGVSGAGKSTFLNIIAGFERADSGQVKIDGLSIEKCHKLGVLAQKIGFVFQAYHLLSGRTVKDNILLPTLYAPSKNYQSQYNYLIKQLKVETLENEVIDNLSGGEKQRVAIARAMILSPSIILADEPTGNLDAQTARQIMQEFESINLHNSVAIIVITHDMQIAKYASKHYMLDNGKLSEY